MVLTLLLAPRGTRKLRHVQSEKAEQSGTSAAQDIVRQVGQIARECTGYLLAPHGVRIVPSACGRFMVAECSAGYGEAATATFIRTHTPLLAADIQRARVIYLRTKQVSGCAPAPEAIIQQFPEIADCCTPQDISTYIADETKRTPRTAALEIMERLFPAYSAGSIERMSRARRRSGSFE